MKLLLTWFKDAERIPPEKLRLADIDRPRVLQFLDWLETERAARGHPQPAPRGDQVVLPLHRRRAARPARPGHPSPRDPTEEHPGPGSRALDRGRGEGAARRPGAASARAVRDTVLLALAYDTAARVQELCDLDVADIRRSNPMTVAIRGKGSKIRYVPAMDPTARLITDYLEHRDPHPGLGADTDPLFYGPNHSRLTRFGSPSSWPVTCEPSGPATPAWAPGLPVTPHTLRRSRAMHLIQAGVNLIYIHDLLGHADVSTTEIYAHADAETKRKAIEHAYEPLTPDVLPDWTLDASLIGWLDSLAR